MSQHDDIEYQLDTLAIRTGHNRTIEGEHSEPIFLTSSFVCENAGLMQLQNSQVKLKATPTHVIPTQPYRLLKNAWQY